MNPSPAHPAPPPTEAKAPAPRAGVVVLLASLALLLVFTAVELNRERTLAGQTCLVFEDPGAESPAASGSAESRPAAPAPPVVPEEYREAIRAAAQVAGLPETLLAAQLQAESAWDPAAVSQVGAQGLAQFMPATWELYGNGGDPFNPFEAIAAQGRYLKALKTQVASVSTDADELVRHTLAAYNAGPGTVLGHEGVPPFQETRAYVDRILGWAPGPYAADCRRA
jgi:soluble lytic murein transglycosylase-like protein